MQRLGEWVLTVSQLTEYVRKMLAADPILKHLRLKGEISNFKRHTSGHIYFTLKDSGAQIRCVMFRTDAMSLSFSPRDGMRVVLGGAASLYAKDGQFQFYVKEIREEGVGELFLAFNELKEKLLKEGLFDAALKKPLPLYPKKVGIATSETGAALQDILRVAGRRNPYIQLVVCHCGVQGSTAVAEVCRSIQRLEKFDCDVIIVGRGGGSLEELWTFNEESVARAVYACKKPVVSAGGHETDFTIIDFVSDVRAPTPSAAAEIVIPEWEYINGILASYSERAISSIRYALTDARMMLSRRAERIGYNSPRAILERQKLALERQKTVAKGYIALTLERNRNKLEIYSRRIEALDPRAVLKRGYAMVEQSGGIKTGVDDLNKCEQVAVVMRDGSFRANIIDIAKEGN